MKQQARQNTNKTQRLGLKFAVFFQSHPTDCAVIKVKPPTVKLKIEHKQVDSARRSLCEQIIFPCVEFKRYEVSKMYFVHVAAQRHRRISRQMTLHAGPWPHSKSPKSAILVPKTTRLDLISSATRYFSHSSSCLCRLSAQSRASLILRARRSTARERQ